MYWQFFLINKDEGSLACEMSMQLSLQFPWTLIFMDNIKRGWSSWSVVSAVHTICWQSTSTICMTATSSTQCVVPQSSRAEVWQCPTIHSCLLLHRNSSSSSFSPHTCYTEYICLKRELICPRTLQIEHSRTFLHLQLYCNSHHDIKEYSPRYVKTNFKTWMLGKARIQQGKLASQETH
jgi:hypothetical protein